MNISEHIYKTHLLLPFTTALGHDGNSKNILGQIASHMLVHNSISNATLVLECTKITGSGYDLLPRQSFRKTAFSNGHFQLRTLQRTTVKFMHQIQVLNPFAGFFKIYSLWSRHLITHNIHYVSGNFSYKIVIYINLYVLHIVIYLLPSDFPELYTPGLLVKHVLHSVLVRIFSTIPYLRLISEVYVLNQLLDFYMDLRNFISLFLWHSCVEMLRVFFIFWLSNVKQMEKLVDEIKRWESKLLNPFSDVKSIYLCLSFVCSTDNHDVVCYKNVHN